jgi:hypothetical protein
MDDVRKGHIQTNKASVAAQVAGVPQYLLGLSQQQRSLLCGFQGAYPRGRPSAAIFLRLVGQS